MKWLRSGLDGSFWWRIPLLTGHTVVAWGGIGYSIAMGLGWETLVPGAVVMGALMGLPSHIVITLSTFDDNRAKRKREAEELRQRTLDLVRNVAQDVAFEAYKREGVQQAQATRAQLMGMSSWQYAQLKNPQYMYGAMSAPIPSVPPMKYQQAYAPNVPPTGYVGQYSGIRPGVPPLGGLSPAYAGPPPYAPSPTPPKKTIDSLTEETALIRGWRKYTVNERGQLKGVRAVWETNSFEAKCNGKSAVDHLLNGCGWAPECGIYSHKYGPEYLKVERIICSEDSVFSTRTPVEVVAQCISSGVVVEHKFGYRAEKCRIERMWLIVPRPCAVGHGVMFVNGVQTNKEDWVYNPTGLSYVNRVTGSVIDAYDMQAASFDIRMVLGSTPPHWKCSDTPSENPGAAYAQVLSTQYGVPCTAIGAVEFLARLDGGTL